MDTLLAGRAGITQGMVSQLEKNVVNYTSDNLQSLAVALDCSIRDLLYRPPYMAELIGDVMETLPDDAQEQAIEILKTFRRKGL